METIIATRTVDDRLPIFALLAANTISLAGSALTMIALPWFVLQTTGSAAMTGLAGFFVALPGFLAGIFGGTLVDRLGYKRVSVVADLVSGIAIALIPLLFNTVGLAFWQLLALIFLGALLEIPGVTARRALLPELAGMARVRLDRFGEGKIYPHEETMSGPKQDRLLLTRACKTNLSQIFGLYPDPQSEAQELLERAIAGQTLSLSIRLACTENCALASTMWPASAMHLLPVWAPTFPCASIIATWRTSRPSSPARSERSASGALFPIRIRSSPSLP